MLGLELGDLDGRVGLEPEEVRVLGIRECRIGLLPDLVFDCILRSATREWLDQEERFR